jgi:P27 family predicted phage terminase small subunit
MGQRGPAPEPVALKLVKGNPGNLAAHRLTDALRPRVEIPCCPSYLLPDAKKEWARITPELKKLHIVSQIDMAALAVYCQAYATWVIAQKKLKGLGADGLVDATPSGYQQMSAWYTISTRASDQMHKYLCEFGMSPSSRARIQANVCVNTDLFADTLEPTAENEPAKPGTSRFFAR